jgi:ubiquinone/menaquinone biosynthesis C-methylase UbiE/uncharacterized protein YbaR (Trm112 family)
MTETANILDRPSERDFTRFSPFLHLLRCPYSHSPLRLVTVASLVSRLDHHERARMPAGITAALISESSSLAYPVVGNIFDFREQGTLRLASTARVDNPEDSEAAAIKQSVQNWYDEFGWRRNPEGVYNDVALFSQTGETGYRLYEILSHLSLLDRFMEGEFLLDAASGAIASSEYLSYSWFYRYRVCVDLSGTALEEAERKLQDRGFCCLADVCRLPFADNVFDGIISGYTIQHIPASEQIRAVEELHRVIKPNRHVCIITNFCPAKSRRVALRAMRFLAKAIRALKLDGQDVPPARNSTAVPKAPHRLYGFLHDVQWWSKVGNDLGARYSIEILRLFSRDEFEYFFGTSTRAAKAVHAFESLSRKSLARISDHILVDLCKTK